MFRENDFRYLVAALVIVLGLTILSILYEWMLAPHDSTLETTVAIIRWQGDIFPIAIIGIATVEVFKVIADRMIAKRKERDIERGREQEREAWQGWNNRRLEAEARKEPFNEPTPAEEKEHSHGP